MNIGLFGGTFDPIHKGHLALAQAARERSDLGRIYFVPANVPPHKTTQPAASYFHRYTMTAMATQGEKTFIPSLLEAPRNLLGTSRKLLGVPSFFLGLSSFFLEPPSKLLGIWSFFLGTPSKLLGASSKLLGIPSFFLGVPSK